MNVEIVQFDTRHGAIEADCFRAERPSGAAVLFLHGDRSSRSGYGEYAEAVAQQTGATCLALDLLGHGKSAGIRDELSAFSHLEAVADVYDSFVEYSEIDASRIGVVGASFGGYLAVMLTGIRSPSSLMLRAPAMYPDGLESVRRKNHDVDRIESFRADRIAQNRSLNIFVASRFTGPVTIVSSEHDESMPRTVIEGYGRVMQRLTIREIEGAGHALEPAERQVFKQMVVEFAGSL